MSSDVTPAEPTNNPATERVAFEFQAARSDSSNWGSDGRQRNDVLVPAWVWFEWVTNDAQSPAAEQSRGDEVTQPVVVAELTENGEPIRPATAVARVESDSFKATTSTQRQAPVNTPLGFRASPRSITALSTRFPEASKVGFMMPTTAPAAASKPSPPAPIAKPGPPRAVNKPKTDPAPKIQAAPHAAESAEAGLAAKLHVR